MPTPLTSLPSALQFEPFIYSQALAAGVGRAALEHRRFTRPFRGVIVPEELARTTPDEVAFSRILRPGEAFSHTTALRLLECPIHCDEQPIHVTISNHQRARRAAGVCGHSTRRSFAPWVDRRDIAIVPPELALVQASELLPMTEIVVAIDHLVLSDPPLVTEKGVEALMRTARSKGSVRLRRALRYARQGSESRMETLTRLLLEAYGLAAFFELQVNLFDDEGWIGRFDLVSERYLVIVEYDGEQHRTDRAQYLKDERRLERARALGYEIIRIHHEDLDRARRHGSVLRVAKALGIQLSASPLVPEFA